VAVLELPSEDGTHIGRYRVVRLLGLGGMGEVLLAWDPDLNRSVAIKRIRHDSNTSLLRQRLLQEAFAVGSLHHPAIVTVYDLLKCEEDDCIVMEYVPGRTLAETLKGGPLEPALAVRLAKRVASGLAAAHEAGFIHRDLKTENVMVTPLDEAKILDFGVAKPMGLAADDPSLTLPGNVVGTCRAMSPEQAKGAEVDQRSDLFSLGVLLYETLTGISPFQGSNALETLSKVISGRPPCLDTLRPGLPPRLVALLVRLLAKEPAGRPQSAGEVVRELEAIAASLGPAGDPEETVSVLPTGAVERWRGDPRTLVARPQPALIPQPETSPQPRRRRFLTAVALSSILILVAGKLFLYLLTQGGPDTSPSWTAPKRLWVVVLNPKGAGHDAQFQHAASALVKASLSTLGHLQNIIPIGPIVGSKSVTEMKRTVAEDFLTVTLEQSGNGGIIKLSRFRGRDGKILGSTVPFRAQIDAQSLLSLEKQVEAKLPEIFSLHPPREDVSREDYATVSRIKQELDKGQAASESELSALKKITEISPNFLDASFLEADIAVTIYHQSQKQGDLERALQLIRKAENLAPADPRPLQSEFRLDLDKPREDDARKILARLSRLDSRNPQIPVLQANLADKEGDPAVVLSDWEEAVAYLPSWRNLLSLAQIEEEFGLARDARDNLEQVLADSPDNSYALSRRAELELDYGEPANAETIYRQLLKSSPTYIDYINLGTAQVLLRRYADAVVTFNDALRIKPKDAAAMLNLGEAELALHHQDRADSLFNDVCRAAVADTINAQCLARLGHVDKAIEIIKNALEKRPDDPDTLRSAALVYTVAGDYDDALKTITAANAKHLGPNWFKLPSFAPLFKDPRFQQSVNGAAH
jgi:serine/threonine protein kinase/tetratricopeptide (TPR) repeat protein